MSIAAIVKVFNARWIGGYSDSYGECHSYIADFVDHSVSNVEDEFDVRIISSSAERHESCSRGIGKSEKIRSTSQW